MFCGKTAFELLCLFEGQQLWKRECFATVRGTVCGPLSEISREVVFDARGPVSSSDVPSIVHGDLTVGQDCPVPIPGLLGSTDLGMHSVAVYEVDGWVCASVAVAGFPPCVLVLAGPDIHLQDLYLFVYDDREDEVAFLKLAYDPGSPVVPLLIGGEAFEALARTYRLREFKAP